MERVLRIEIIAYAPTDYYHCTHCEVAWREVEVTHIIHTQHVISSLPPDLLEQYQAISDWVREILRRHCERVDIKVVDATSIEGFLKSLRYSVRKYPAVIIQGHSHFVGGQLQEAAYEIDRLIRMEESSAVNRRANRKEDLLRENKSVGTNLRLRYLVPSRENDQTPGNQ